MITTVEKKLTAQGHIATKAALVSAVAGALAVISGTVSAECGNDEYGACVTECEIQYEMDKRHECDSYEMTPQEYRECRQSVSRRYEECKSSCWDTYCGNS
jgi:hypothetical protein